MPFWASTLFPSPAGIPPMDILKIFHMEPIILKNVFRVMTISFFILNLAILFGCEPYKLDRCNIFPGIGSCPPLPSGGKEASKHYTYPGSEIYREICKSWQGRHIDELIKSWGKNYSFRKIECPSRICEGYPQSVDSIFSFVVRGKGVRSEENLLGVLLFLSTASNPLKPDVEEISCATQFAVDDKGNIIAVGPTSNQAAEIWDCTELIIRREWRPKAAPGWFDDLPASQAAKYQ
jgi:hypothetical protein